jgi:ribosomal protein L17
MPATPRRSRSFGGSAHHQRLLLANMAASLFAAEGITTTEGKAKALRPIAEKLITKAIKAQGEGPMRVHRIRQIQSSMLLLLVTPHATVDTSEFLNSDPATVTTRQWRASNSSRTFGRSCVARE